MSGADAEWLGRIPGASIAADPLLGSSSRRLPQDGIDPSALDPEWLEAA